LLLLKKNVFMSLAPIVLFVYNRPDHTRRTIEALSRNVLALDSDFIIYSDAPKNVTVQKDVDEVRRIIKEIKGFKSVEIIEREVNFGLANSIIDGVTKIINQYGRIIVLEDDMVTSPQFLNFMNNALEAYKNEENVWHISGWNYPINEEGLNLTFLWRTMNCWGWATWKDRWCFFEKDTSKLIREFAKDDIYRFNLDNSENFWSQVIGNNKGRINTWAIYWYATIFKNNGLCLNPVVSFVKNIGFDGSGTHCGKENNKSVPLNTSAALKFPEEIEENNSIVLSIMRYYKAQRKSLIVRIINKISRSLTGENLLK
jgi:hypothetical protein